MKAIWGLLLAVVTCLALPTSAFAVASYVFEPTLSLVGKCAKPTILDPVEDPGCPEGKHPPGGAFQSPGVATDAYGDIYVVNIVEGKGRVDVFGPTGLFITEIKDEAGPQSIAIDSEGNLYAYERVGGGERQVRRFPPTVYEPKSEEIEYGNPPIKIAGYESEPYPFGPAKLQPASSVAVDPATDHLYVDYSQGVAVFSSANEENKLLEKEAIKIEEEVEGKPVVRDLLRSTSIAIDAKHKRIYLSDKVPVTFKSIIRIFDLEAPHKEVGSITGSTTPKGEFLSGEGFLPLDVDENAGHIFVGDIAAASKVYEFDEAGAYLATIEHSFNNVPNSEIAVDDGRKSLHHPQKEAWLFVPSDPVPATLGHVYAFEPKEQGPPSVESTSVDDVTETEAILRGTVNPDGLPTEYRLEYVSQQQFEEEEGKSFENKHATLAGQGSLPKGAKGIDVSASATELEPGTRYRFRAFAENNEGAAETEKAFRTFPSPVVDVEPCENEGLRIGLSVLLPDCRAYELVTPPDTNGHSPIAGFSGSFPTLLASPVGDRASFVIEGGLIPGHEGTGSFDGDRYVSSRGPKGWSTSLAGPSGEEAFKLTPGSISPDQTYAFWGDVSGAHIHYPGGHSEFIGRGSLGEDPEARGRLITEGATHIVFTTEAGSAVQLEPNAPPTKTAAVYDRSAEGPTNVVSLLPGNVTPAAKEDAKYLGSSEDGEGIAFSIGGTIYLRLHHEESFEVAAPGAKFAGVVAHGTRVFYTEGGDLLAFDVKEPAEPIEFSSSGDVTPINVAEDGSRAYFISPSVLTKEPNPNGEKAKEDAQNLYLSEEGAISFVGQVTKRDVEGEKLVNGLRVGGLGLWVEALEGGGPGKDSSRTTPSGTTLLFEARTNLTGFDSEGFAQVYRYDSAQNRLSCLSCNPTDLPPTSDASLQSIGPALGAPEPGNGNLKIPNQSPDGRRAFFQTAEPLVLGDIDGLLDVYEWEEKGVGRCKQEDGCVNLISGGHSASPDYLFAMSSSGDDIFFRTADILLPRDLESTLSIYDARVEGGFAEEESCGEACCEGDACRPVGSTPELPQPSTAVSGLNESPPPEKKCAKGKHKIKRHGNVVCVKNHKHKKHHRKANSGRMGGGK